MNYAISRYLNIRQAYGPVFSGDGRRLAFLSNITGLPQVWQVEGDRLASAGEPLPWPEQLSFAGDRVMGAWFSPAAGDGRLLYARDVGGNEKAQLFLLSADGATETALTAGYEEAMHLFGEWSADGHSFLFAANRRDPMLFDLYLQPLDGPARLLWPNDQPGFLWHVALAPNGRRAAFVRAAASFQHDLFEIELNTGVVRPLSPAGEEARYGPVRYLPGGRSLLVNTDKVSDFMVLAHLELNDLGLRPLASREWDIETFALSPDGRKLALVVNVDGVGELQALDLATGQQWAAPVLDGTPGVMSALLDRPVFAPDSRRLAFSFTSPTRTADVFIWDMAANQSWPVTRSSHGGLPRAAFAAPELVRYPTFDGRTIPAWFYRPAGQNGPAPAVIVVHGGPEGQSLAAFNFLIQYLAGHGYAVLAPNVRGSTGYGKAYSHLDDVERRMESVADLAHAAAWLQARPEIDGRRLAVYGGSYGGFMVLAALTTYPDLWAAGVCLVGISNFVTFLENTSSYRRAHREKEYGSLERDREFLAGISPIHQVDKITAPLMVIHGANDPRVPAGEAAQIVAALRQRDVPVEYLLFEDEGHGLVKLANKLVAYPAVVAFLKRYV
ncbi:MAG: S9 family peptidase [Chloroflexi bacterium]|nr:S9 family peptidase [Chloroflexota bacterium]MCI0581102.1 S9 family peptidase [Chloroflexota bacterium]MCI0649851.1 S9 family peptidase [Chloroflexota bacterium]MCI0731340.1 S9 family peptidase [Chloroflexota bacterium]